MQPVRLICLGYPNSLTPPLPSKRNPRDVLREVRGGAPTPIFRAETPTKTTHSWASVASPSLEEARRCKVETFYVVVGALRITTSRYCEASDGNVRAKRSWRYVLVCAPQPTSDPYPGLLVFALISSSVAAGTSRSFRSSMATRTHRAPRRRGFAAYCHVCIDGTIHIGPHSTL